MNKKWYRDRNKLKGFILGLFIATVPWNRPLSIVIFSLFIILWISESSLQEKYKLAKTRLRVLFPAILFILYGISLFYSENKNFSYVETKLFLLVLPLVLTATRIYKEQIIIILETFVLGSFLATITSFVLAINFYNQPTEHFSIIHLPHQLSSILHAPYFSLLLVLSNLFILLKQKLKNQPVGPYLILIVYFSLFILILSSRTALVCNFLLLCIYFYYQLRPKHKLVSFLSFLLGIIAILVITYFAFPHFQERVSAFSKEGNGISDRAFTFKASLEVISENPLLGVGIGDLQTQLNKIYNRWNLSAYFYSLNPHNEYLYTAASTGVIGFFLLLVMLLLPTTLSFKTKNYLIAAFYLIFVLSFMTEALLARYWGVALFSFFYAIFFSYLVDKKEETKAESHNEKS